MLRLSILCVFLISSAKAFPQITTNEVDTFPNPKGFQCNNNEIPCNGNPPVNNSVIAKQKKLQQPPSIITPIHPHNLVYPEEDTNKNRTASHNRKPLVGARSCDNTTELLYPGDNEGDWVCDCKPAFLYVPSDQKCYAAYKRGPCQGGEILILDSKRIAHCLRNECNGNNKVFFNGQCHTLDTEEGCKEFKKLAGRKMILTVDPTTLILACIDESENIICFNRDAKKCCRTKNGSNGTSEQCFEPNQLN